MDKGFIVDNKAAHEGVIVDRVAEDGRLECCREVRCVEPFLQCLLFVAVDRHGVHVCTPDAASFDVSAAADARSSRCGDGGVVQLVRVAGLDVPLPASIIGRRHPGLGLLGETANGIIDPGCFNTGCGDACLGTNVVV